GKCNASETIRPKLRDAIDLFSAHEALQLCCTTDPWREFNVAPGDLQRGKLLFRPPVDLQRFPRGTGRNLKHAEAHQLFDQQEPVRLQSRERQHVLQMFERTSEV